jgi:phage terminase large subunit GpA-like protein
MITRDVPALARELAQLLKPRPPITGLAYADEHFYVTGNSEGIIRWITRPYQCDWFIGITDPHVQCVICKKPARIGWTEYVKCVIQYFVDWRRLPVLVVHPTEADSELFVNEHIDEGLFHPTKSPPRLRGLFDYSGSKKAKTNNKDMKVASNGALVQFANAGSPSSARGVNRPVVCLEEVSGYLAIKEGDVVANFQQRAGSALEPFFTIGATPVHADDNIETAFRTGDQQYRFFPCPHCGTYDELMTRDAWKLFITEGEHAGKKRCYSCGELIEYKHLRWMDENAGWACPLGLDRSNQVLDEDGQPIYRSFQVGPGQSYHRAQRWPELARRHRIAKEELRRGKPEAMMSFHMTDMGLAWEPDYISQITAEGLAARQQDAGQGNAYPPDGAAWEAPRGVLLITIGVDVQGGGGTIGEGFRVQVWGWGVGEESWHLAEMQIDGDPRQETTLEQLDAVMATTWHREDGARLTATLGAIDEGGLSTEAVRRFCASRAGRWVPVRGMPQPRAELLGRGTAATFDSKNKARGRVGRDLMFFGVGYEASVNRWAARLAIRTPGPGYVHLGRAASAQTLAELFPWKRQPITPRSDRFVWRLPRGSNDEAGDCTRYAYAALGLVARRYARPDVMWAELERKAAATVGGVGSAVAQSEERPQSTGWLDQGRTGGKRRNWLGR